MLPIHILVYNFFQKFLNCVACDIHCVYYKLYSQLHFCTWWECWSLLCWMYCTCM